MQHYLLAFLTIAGIHLLAVMSPGPDFALVAKNSLTYDKDTGLFTALGIAVGATVHITYCVLGLALVIAHSLWLFNLIKFAGASYLIYVGMKSLMTSSCQTNANEQRHHASISPLTAFKQGFLCNLLNPKGSLFFLGLFTLVVNPNTPFLIQSAYGLEMTLATFLWFAFLSHLLNKPWLRQRINRAQHTINKVLGGILVAFGIKLAFAHKIHDSIMQAA